MRVLNTAIACFVLLAAVNIARAEIASPDYFRAHPAELKSLLNDCYKQDPDLVTRDCHDAAVIDASHLFGREEYTAATPGVRYAGSSVMFDKVRGVFGWLFAFSF